MPRKVLVTGANGFIGARLLPELAKAGYEASGPDFDVLEPEALDRVLSQQRWDVVIHLAAVSHVPTCEQAPERAYRVNTVGTALLLDAIERNCPGAHLVFASTAQVYAVPAPGEAEMRVAITEEGKIAPQNTYARTKWSSELLISDRSIRGGVGSTLLRLFNHTHRTQSADFFLPHLYSKLSNALPGNVVSIPVGNLDLYRDLGSISDLLQAFVAIINARAHVRNGTEIYNVCSGKPKKLGTLAQKLAERMGVRAEFRLDPSKIRTGEPGWLGGSHDKITLATGWQPRCRTEDDLIADFLT